MSDMDHLEYICQSFAFSQIVLLYLKNKSKCHRCDFGWAFSYFLPFSRTEDRGTTAVSCSIFLLCVLRWRWTELPTRAKLPENVCFSSFPPVPQISLFFLSHRFLLHSSLRWIFHPRVYELRGDSKEQQERRKRGLSKNGGEVCMDHLSPAWLCVSACSSATLSSEV